MKKSLLLLLLLASSVSFSRAGILQRGKVQMFCHRTANTDMPENTLESLALAARMGCNLVELDIRRTLDGCRSGLCNSFGRSPFESRKRRCLGSCLSNGRKG